MMTEGDKKRVQELITRHERNAAVFLEMAAEAKIQKAAMAELRAWSDEAEKALIEGGAEDRERAQAFLAQCDALTKSFSEGTPESREQMKAFLDQLAEANNRRGR